MVHLTKECLISFGMYKGTKLKDLPAGYLLFLYEKKKLFGSYKAYVEKNKASLEADKKRVNREKSR